MATLTMDGGVVPTLKAKKVGPSLWVVITGHGPDHPTVSYYLRSRAELKAGLRKLWEKAMQYKQLFIESASQVDEIVAQTCEAGWHLVDRRSGHQFRDNNIVVGTVVCFVRG